MIIPDSVRQSYFDNPIGGLAMYLVGPLSARLAFRVFVVIVGTLMPRRGGEHGHCGLEWRFEPRFRRRNSSRLVPPAAPAFRNVLSHSETWWWGYNSPPSY